MQNRLNPIRAQSQRVLIRGSTADGVSSRRWLLSSEGCKRPQIPDPSHCNHRPAIHKDVSRRRWEPPVVKAAGTVGDVLRNGGGKVTVLTGDPGEPRKVPAQDR